MVTIVFMSNGERDSVFGSDDAAESFEEVCCDCDMGGIDLNRNGRCEACVDEAEHERHIDAQIDADRDGSWE